MQGYTIWAPIWQQFKLTYFPYYTTVLKHFVVFFSEVPGVSEKKYGVADYQYILRMITYSNVTFSDILSYNNTVCEVSTQYV